MSRRIDKHEFDPDHKIYSSDVNLVPIDYRYFDRDGKQVHRDEDDEPALIDTLGIGIKYWVQNGKLHRENGPAVIDPRGPDEYWMIKGKYHREDGPAVIMSDGTKKWYRHGKLHRTDGPALEFSSGDIEWWLYGKRSSSFWNYIQRIKGKERLTILKLKYPKYFAGKSIYPE